MGGRLWPDFSSRTCQLLPVIRHPVVPEASTDGHVPAFRSVSFISFPTSTFSMSAACCPIAFTPAFLMTVAPFLEVWWRLEIVSFFFCAIPLSKSSLWTPPLKGRRESSREVLSSLQGVNRKSCEAPEIRDFELENCCQIGFRGALEKTNLPGRDPGDPLGVVGGYQTPEKLSCCQAKGIT